MKSCEDFEKLISERQDEPLAHEDDRALNEHLAGCTLCQEFADAVSLIRAQIRALPEAAPLAGKSAEIKNVGFWKRKFALPIPVAAALLLIAISGWLVAFSMTEETMRAGSSSSPLVHSVEIITVPAAHVIPLLPDQKNSVIEEDTL